MESGKCPTCRLANTESLGIEHKEGQLVETMHCLGECGGYWENEYDLKSKLLVDKETSFEVELLRTTVRRTRVQVTAANALHAVRIAMETSDPGWGSEEDYDVSAGDVRRV